MDADAIHTCEQTLIIGKVLRQQLWFWGLVLREQRLLLFAPLPLVQTAGLPLLCLVTYDEEEGGKCWFLCNAGCGKAGDMQRDSHSRDRLLIIKIPSHSFGVRHVSESSYSGCACQIHLVPVLGAFWFM